MQNVETHQNPQTAALVRKARRHLGLNQGQFAARIGKSQAVVSRYEQGSVAPPGEVIMHCMHILGEVSAASETQVSSWSELLTALEAAVAIVKSMQEASPNLNAGDTDDENSRLPRQA
jgi:predicted transcriptional regulator